MTATASPELARDLLHDGGAGFLRLESVDAARNRFRFYTFAWQQTLWGEWAICCTWGRIGSLGRSRIAYLGAHSGIADALADLVTRRPSHGHASRRKPENRSGCGP